MISTTMKACQEYSSFAIDPSNRDISDLHVDRLEDAVTDVYLLDAYPIVTTAERVIVDGQHRFKLAKSLGIPFYYIAGDGITIEDVSMANANTEKYTLADALHVYSRLGIEPYQYLETFAQKYRCLPIGYLASKLSSSYKTGDFAKGHYLVNRINYAREVVEKLTDFASHKRDVWRWPSYRSAIEILVMSPLYDHKRMMNRLSRNPTRIVPCGRAEEVLSLLTDEIYNYNIPTKNRVDLTIANQHKKSIREDVVIKNTKESPRRGMVCSSNVQIFKETNLDKFRVHPSCRPLRRVDKLTDAIKTRNLLQFYPIIVDRDLVVYDGQRRLEAARRASVPIYYIVLQNVSMWMIARAGGLSKAWGLRDYLKHFASLGFPAYVRMVELMKQYDFLSYESLLSFLGSTATTPELRAKFRSGQFVIDDSMLPLLTLFSSLPDRVAKRVRLQITICLLYRKHKTAYFLKRTRDILTTNESVFMLDMDSTAQGIKFVDLYNNGLLANNRIEYLGD